MKKTKTLINSKGRAAIVEEYDPERMVLRSLSANAMPTAEQVKMIKEAEKHPIVYEDDCPELTPAMAEAFKKAAQTRDAARKKKIV